jgi:hypothetical protein
MRALLARYAEERDPARRGQLAELEQQFARLTDERPHRGAGKHYADRALVSEECTADFAALRVEHRAAAEAAPALGVLMDMLSLPTLARRWAARVFFRQTWGDRAVPFAEVERGLAQAEDTLERLRLDAPQQGSLLRLRAAIELSLAHAAGGEAVLPIAALAAAVDERHLVDGAASHYSLDLVPFLDRGRLRFVVGETHALLWIQPFLYHHLPEREELARSHHDLMRHLLRGHTGAEVVFRHTAKVDLRPATPLDYELLVDGASQVGRERTIAIGDVSVSLEGERFVFRAPGVGEFVPVAVGALPIAFQLLPSVYPAFWKDGGSFPAELLPAERSALPRLTLGPLVIRRRSWSLTTGELRALLGQGLDLVGAARLKQRFGWPDQVFCRAPGQPKPVLLDLRSRHLLELFQHQLGADSGAPVTVSEMLPNPDELALCDADGRRTCEMRMCAYRLCDEGGGG